MRDRRARPRRRPAAPRRRVPVRRREPQRALRDGRRAARRRTSPGSSRWAPRTSGARWPGCRRSRSPTTRRSSPGVSPATTASCTTRGSTARRGEQVITNSQATWPWSMQHLTAGRRDAARRGPPHVARRVHRVGQRAVRRRRRLLHLRLLPPRRGAADPGVTRRPAAHHRAVRAPVEGLLVVVGRRPHGRRAGRRHLERPLPRPVVPAAAVHVVQLHAHRLRVPRGRPVLRDRRRRRCATPTPASARCSRRSSAPACSTTPRSCSSPTTACRRPTPRSAATGTSRCARPGIEFRDEGYGFLYRRRARRDRLERLADEPCRCRT